MKKLWELPTESNTAFGLSDTSHFDTVLEWFPTDEKSRYEENLLKYPSIMKKWEDVDITYDINEYGFRSPSFYDSNNNIVFLGCSHTTGIGLPLEKTFPYLISEKLGMNLCNLSVPGRSNDTCYRLGSFWIPILKPKVVICYVVSKARMEVKVTSKGSFIHGDSTSFYHNFLPSKDNVDVLGINFGDFYEQWCFNEENLDYNKQKNMDALETVCSRNGSKFYCFDDVFITEKYLNPAGRPYLGDLKYLARDTMHPGEIENQFISDTVLGELGYDKNQKALPKNQTENC